LFVQSYKLFPHRSDSALHRHFCDAHKIKQSTTSFAVEEFSLYVNGLAKDGKATALRKALADLASHVAATSGHSDLTLAQLLQFLQQVLHFHRCILGIELFRVCRTANA
jgi:hypothetical protein